MTEPALPHMSRPRHPIPAAASPPGMESPLAFAVGERDRETIAMVRRAVEGRQVQLAFQPVVQTARPGHPAFYEGLVRIPDRSGRIIPAREFIDVVETTELGRRIDCLALSLGLDALEAAPGLRLAINMSARSIGYPDWLSILHARLDPRPELAERLILEITESSAMLVPEIVAAFMTRLQRRGIAFALDDFGAGQTSFRYLRDFCFDMVKIDGQFIRGLHESPDNQVLVQAMIGIGRHFDMFTVAESVEDAQDAACLAAMGIDCMQGYHFGAPSIAPPWQIAASRG